jgi:hypothetical protein
MGGAGLPVSTAVSFVFPTREIQTPRIFFKYRRRLLGELSRAGASPDMTGRPGVAYS